MGIITTITTALAFILYFIITLPFLIVLYPFRKKHPIGVSKVAQPLVKAGFSSVLFCTGSKRIVLGLENIPKDRAVMFASNHRGIFDAVAGYATLPVRCGFVAKKQLRKAPFLSWWMDMCNCFFLDRDDPRSGLKMVLNSIDLVNKGVSTFISPEGTRSKTAEMNPFKEGCFKIATKTGCPIVPVAISGSDEIFENHKPFIKPTIEVIEYGKPIYLDELSAEEKKFVGAYTQKKVAEMLEGHAKYRKKKKAVEK